MNFKKQIEADYIEALKAKESLKVSTLRMLKSALKNKEIDSGASLAEEDFFKLVATLVKQRKESVEQYRSGGREELAAQEEVEIEILNAYQPKQLDNAQIEALVTAAIAEANASSPSQMGAVMKLLMPKTAGRADGKVVSQLVQKKLKEI